MINFFPSTAATYEICSCMVHIMAQPCCSGVQNPLIIPYASKQANSKYTIHRTTSTKDVIYLKSFGPPSSPPTGFDLLASNITMAARASEQKIVTENARLKRKISIMQSPIIHDTDLNTAGQSEITSMFKYLFKLFALFTK